LTTFGGLRQCRSALKRWQQPWPVDRPRNWLAEVNEPMAEDRLQFARQSVTKGVPLGDQTWKARIAKRPGLRITLRPRGRARKDAQTSC